MTWLITGLMHWKSTATGTAVFAVFAALWSAFHGSLTATPAGTVLSITLPADWLTWSLGLAPVVAGLLFRPRGPLLPSSARMVLWIALLPFLSGCSHVIGYAGAHPGYVKCKGKISLTGSGQTALAAGLGGSGNNSFTIMGDCGDGFELSQGQPAPVPPAK